jgi:hypothetical protein
MIRSLALLVGSVVCFSSTIACAQPAPADDAAAAQSKREAALAEMLSGATLEGSFTVTGPGRDPTKLDGKLWLIPARIQYGGKDVQLPITLPIEWAADTPVVVVDNLGLPGFGTVSARVMFFADHYAGYWQHGDAGGHLFGTIHHAKAAHRGQAAAAAAGESAE